MSNLKHPVVFFKDSKIQDSNDLFHFGLQQLSASGVRKFSHSYRMIQNLSLICLPDKIHGQDPTAFCLHNFENANYAWLEFFKSLPFIFRSHHCSSFQVLFSFKAKSVTCYRVCSYYRECYISYVVCRYSSGFYTKKVKLEPLW